MEKLTEAQIIALMLEEWNSKLQKVNEAVEGKLNSIDIVSPGLKVMHKKSRYRYTVASVGQDDVILKTPEGENFLVDAETLEKNYELS